MRQGAKRTRARLEFSEQSLRPATDAADAGTWDFDLITNVLTWSDRTKAMFGVASDRPCTMADLYAGVHPDDRAATAAAFALALNPIQRAAYNVEYRVIDRHTGAVRWIGAEGRGLFGPHGRCIRAAGTAIEITKRKPAAQRLRGDEALLAESEQKFRAITESIDQMVWSARPDGEVDFLNQRYYDYTGVAPGSTSAEARAEVIHPDQREHALESWRRCLQTGDPYEVEVRLRDRSGGYRWALNRAAPVRDAQDRITHWCGTCTDIQSIVEAREATERAEEHLESELARRTRKHDLAWRVSQDLLVICDKQGTLREVNPAWTATLGWQRKELVGRHHLEFIYPDDQSASRGALAKAAVAGLRRYESRVLHRDGSFRWISWAATPDGDRIYASGRDVTAEKATAQALAGAEEQLRQSQKLQAIGQLTGGIAHDFNNLLMGIIGNLELLQHRVATGRLDGLERYAAMAATSAHSAAALSQRLLAFARRQPLDPKRVEANRLLAGMEDLLRRTLGSSIEVETNFDGAPWPTLCDPNQLENAMLNLAINARDAMPGGGRLTIGTANVQLDDAFALARSGEAEPNQSITPFLAISVTDTGVGMAPEVIARAFDPFFTTKPAGKGTGLGLSMLYGFVKQSGGHVRIDSKPGQGTTFTVYLPRCHDEATAEPAGQAA